MLVLGWLHHRRQTRLNFYVSIKLHIMVEDGRKVKAKGKRKKAARLEILLDP